MMQGLMQSFSEYLRQPARHCASSEDLLPYQRAAEPPAQRARQPQGAEQRPILEEQGDALGPLWGKSPLLGRWVHPGFLAFKQMNTSQDNWEACIPQPLPDECSRLARELGGPVCTIDWHSRTPRPSCLLRLGDRGPAALQRLYPKARVCFFWYLSMVLKCASFSFSYGGDLASHAQDDGLTYYSNMALAESPATNDI
eukprot:Skav208041  [mRNA]  locus=scaffold2536:19665:20406:- [translate_table: standard]